MSRRRSSGSACLIILLAGACIFIGLSGTALLVIPQIIASEIGPASPGLNSFQRVLIPLQLLIGRNDLTSPMDLNGQKQSFTVRMGETANSVAERLQESSLVRSAELFRLYLVYSGLDTSIQAGDYQLSSAQTMLEIGRELQDATPEEVDFVILPGWRAEEIAAALPTSGLQVPPLGFLNVVKTSPGVTSPEGLGINRSLEGFLMPGLYRFNRQARADEMVRAFATSFDEQVNDDLRAHFIDNGLNLGEAVILASIVQREAILEEEQPIIASVFLNRLAAGMPLESDPTVQYALGFNNSQQSWWTNPLSLDDLKINSAYNTYRNGGLPPGPISNPGLTALRSVAYPAQTPYYFFRAACDQSGRHSFSKTYEEHLQNDCP